MIDLEIICNGFCWTSQLKRTSNPNSELGKVLKIKKVQIFKCYFINQLYFFRD